MRFSYPFFFVSDDEEEETDQEMFPFKGDRNWIWEIVPTLCKVNPRSFGSRGP